MSSYMYEFRQRLKHMQEQGFIIPRNILNIKLEKTARKYTYAKIAEKSTFREMYQGKERIVSGKRGLELLRSKSAQKGAETKRKKKEGVLPPVPPVPPVKPWEDEKRDLIANINAILDSFHSGKLGNQLKWLFDKKCNTDKESFWIFMLSQKEEIISQLQDDSRIRYDDTSNQNIVYQKWESFLNYGETVSLERMKEISEEADEYEDEDM